MSLNPDARIGPYEVLSAIGSGGMGEVYRAHDTRLQRDVAIKVLPALLATDAERLACFERDPDWSALPRETSPALRRLLTRCLTKDPKPRLRDIGEARIAIDEILASKDAAPAATGARSRIEAVPVGGGTRRVVIDGGDYVLAITPDRIAFQREDGLYVAPFDPGHAQLAGSPVRVSEQVHMNPNGSPAADLAGTGALIFAASHVFHGRLVWVSNDGIERVINAPPRGYQNVRVSPDGRHVAFSEAGVIWTLDVDRGAMTRVYVGANGLTGFPVWSADGTRLFFRSSDGIYVQRADGEGQAQLLADTTRLDYPSSVSQDGTMLVLLRILSDSGGDILVAPLKGGPLRTVVATRAYEGGPQISPDGKWLAYVSNESGRMEVYLRPMEGPDRKWPVSAGGGLHPLWSRDGRQVFFRSGQQMRVVDVQTTPEVRLGAPRTLFERRYSFGPNLTVPNYSLSRDGRQFLLVREESGSGHLSLIFNWLQNVGR